MYQTYLGEQFDYGDMNEADQGDYDTLRPFDGDDDLLQDERGEKKATEKESHREGQQVLDEVREEVLMLEGCQSSRKLRPEPPSDDAQVRASAFLSLSFFRSFVQMTDAQCGRCRT